MATMTLSGACVLKAGANVNTEFTGVNAEANWEVLILQMESLINNAVRFNFTDVYSTLNLDVKYTLEEICSNLAAVYAINYDMSGIVTASSLIEAEDRITVLRDAALRGISILRDKKVETFIKNA